MDLLNYHGHVDNPLFSLCKTFRSAAWRVIRQINLSVESERSEGGQLVGMHDWVEWVKSSHVYFYLFLDVQFEWLSMECHSD